MTPKFNFPSISPLIFVIILLKLTVYISTGMNTHLKLNIYKTTLVSPLGPQPVPPPFFPSIHTFSQATSPEVNFDFSLYLISHIQSIRK